MAKLLPWDLALLARINTRPKDQAQSMTPLIPRLKLALTVESITGARIALVAVVTLTLSDTYRGPPRGEPLTI